MTRQSMAAPAKLVTVAVQNASPATIVLTNALLWGSGAWEPGGAPVLGQSFGPGVTLLNGVPDPYASFGGSVTLTPSDGGTLTASWNWPAGSPLQPSATGTSTTLTMTCWTANGSTSTPTVNFSITPVTT